MADIALLGECMLELSPVPEAPGQYRLGVAGDTFNTAVALAQLGQAVEYLSGLGEDAHSEQILATMAANGVGGSLVRRLPDAIPGLYLIDNDASGERFFSYWRSDSAARQVLNDPLSLLRLLEQARDIPRLFFSGISLALCGDSGREALFDWLGGYRAAGGQVIYDSNYRPALWPALDSARQAHRQVLALTDLFLPGVEDELVLQGLRSKSALTDHLRELPIGEIVLKDGGEGLVLFAAGESSTLELEPVAQVIDATGAGDSFNGGYLGARLAGKDMHRAAAFASQVAAHTICHRGAVLPAEHWQELGAALAALD